MSASTFGLWVLRAAKRDLDRPVVETSRNAGPFIFSVYQQPRGFGPGAPWCALALWSWVEHAAIGALGDPNKLPIKPNALARAWIPSFEEVGGWTPKERFGFGGHKLEPGDVLVWKSALANQNPAFANRGHIGIVESVDGDVATTIEGNGGPLGDRVARVRRKLTDPLLLGAGRFPNVGRPIPLPSSGGFGLALLALLAGAVLVVARRKRT